MDRIAMAHTLLAVAARRFTANRRTESRYPRAAVNALMTVNPGTELR